MGGAGGIDILVIKINPLGGIIWARTYGGPDDEMGLSIINQPENGFAIAGYTASFGFGQADLLMMQLDSTGRLLRRRTFGNTGDDGAYTMTMAPDGDYVVAGSTTSYGGGGYDALIVKLNSSMDIPGCNRITIPPVSVRAPNVIVTIPPVTVLAPAIKVISPGTVLTTPTITLGSICQ